MKAVKDFIHKMELIDVIEEEARSALEFSAWQSPADNLYLFLACLTAEIVTEEDACMYIYDELNFYCEDKEIADTPFLAKLASSLISHKQIAVAMKIMSYARIIANAEAND